MGWERCDLLNSPHDFPRQYGTSKSWKTQHSPRGCLPPICRGAATGPQNARPTAPLPTVRTEPQEHQSPPTSLPLPPAHTQTLFPSQAGGGEPGRVSRTRCNHRLPRVHGEAPLPATEGVWAGATWGHGTQEDENIFIQNSSSSVFFFFFFSIHSAKGTNSKH
ncbi:unnamed protein product [Pipistrellus nathusii]|uniref:Uncharacterized protein n=1 Tax=Pipistrellus nathusii TaxID=59473 RepID=A0ABP0A5V3_PIPNA